MRTEKYINLKKKLEGINSRLGDTEKCVSDRIMETTQSEQQKEKK